MGIFDEVHTTTTQLDPWDQTDENLGLLLGNINTGLSTPWASYQGDWIEDMNPDQQAALNAQIEYGMGGQQDLADTFSAQGGKMMPAYDSAQQFYDTAVG